MSISILRTIEQTSSDQSTASLQWQTYLRLGNDFRDVDMVPNEIEMTLRNPAVYKDRLNSGEIQLPDGLETRWDKLNLLARSICEMSGYLPENQDNSAGDLQHLAFVKELPFYTVRPLNDYLEDSAELFTDSLAVDYGPESLLRYFSGNAKCSVGGAAEAKSRLDFATRTSIRIQNRKR